jgi:tetratricopeptide (TPR) repeat protein
MLKQMLRPPIARSPTARAPVGAADITSLLREGRNAEEAGRMDAAEASYGRAFALGPEHADAAWRFGEVLLTRGKLDQAVSVLERAAAAHPDNPIVQFRLAGAYLRLGRRDEAVARMRQAAFMQGGFAPAMNDLGNLHKERGEFDRAETCYREAVRIAPTYAIGWHNLACTLRDKDALGQALECFEQALALNPDYHEARLARALVLLGCGRLGEGWEAYRARWSIPERKLQQRPFRYPEWRGEALAGRRLLVWGEQGIGDELLHSALIGEIATQCGRCVLECHPKLARLLERALPSVEVVPWRSPPDSRLQSGFDFQIAGGDLAARLRPQLSSFPAQSIYLRPDPARAAYWRGRLQDPPSVLRVGICWRSSDMSGERPLKCTRLEDWGAILCVPGVRFVCLQYDECSAEVQAARQRLGAEIEVFPQVDLFDDLDETAALMSGLDLVISAPTAISVQAAALGIETWQLNSGFDWQRMGTNANVWLPAMLQFRKRWNESWDTVFGQVTEKLRAKVRAALSTNEAPAQLEQSARALIAGLLDRPRDAELLCAVAAQALRSGRKVEAISCLRRAAKERPQDMGIVLALGDVARQLGWWDEAIAAYETIHRSHPDRIEVLLVLGTACEAGGRAEQAERCYREAIRLQPDFAAAHLNLGNVLRARGALEDARVAYERALAHHAGSAKAHANLANLYKLQGNLGAAEQHFLAALALEPGNLRFLLGCGAARHDMGRLHEAIRDYDRALALEPDCREAKLNRAHALLAKGDLEEGWRANDVRFELGDAGVQRKHAHIPAWNGGPLASRRLLVWGEQGLGDEILFASMYPDLQPHGHNVTIECHPKLRTLFQRSFAASRVVASSQTGPQDGHSDTYDLQIAAGGLGRLLRNRLERFPARRAYLVADAARRKHWRGRLDALGPGAKIGFCWRSSNLEGERALSCPELVHWERLFALDRACWICLQYDECSAELQAPMRRHPGTIHRFAEIDYYNDLDEVSALTAELDLVVSAPTTVSMHAAALGVETWQFSFGSDWQLLGADRNPWLPALRRYPRAWTDSWADVFERVAADLDARLREPVLAAAGAPPQADQC